jgi:phosphoribosyl 1,2-cyclic phosphate phosphodiesterase
VLVDTSPDLRLQTAGAGVRHADAVLYSHDHADQTHGIDDLRAFMLGGRGRLVPCYMEPYTYDRLTSRFGYIFHGENGYPPIAEPREMPPYGAPFTIDGPGGSIPVLPFEQDHGTVRSVGFRFGGLAYSSDLVDLPPESFAALQDLDVWILDALRWTPHPTHAHVGRALDWIARVKPKRAILTNLHLDLDYNALAAQLPAGVEPAYDGMRIELAR